MKAIVRTICFVAVALAAPAAYALEIDFQFDPNRHNRFLSGFGSNPVQNPNVLGMPGLDFSGVGWGSGGAKTINVAMVTPMHFIVAEHFRPAVGTNINFLGADGVLRSYTVGSYIPLKYDEGNPNNTSDLMIGQLTTAIQPSHNIRIYNTVRPAPFQYPLESTPQSTLDFYRGRQVIVVGQNDQGGPDADGDGYNDRGGKIGSNYIEQITVFNFGNVNSNTVGDIWRSLANTPDSARLVSGDSGSPTFLLYNGQLTALGSHSGIGAGPNGQLNADGFLPYYVDRINQLIIGTGFQIFVTVPEPSALALMGTAAAGLVFLRRRRWIGA